jgi:hypothetical protein
MTKKTHPERERFTLGRWGPDIEDRMSTAKADWPPAADAGDANGRAVPQPSRPPQGRAAANGTWAGGTRANAKATYEARARAGDQLRLSRVMRNR